MKWILGASVILFALSLILHAEDTGTPGQNTHRMAGIGVVVGNDVRKSTRIQKFILIRGLQDNSPAMRAGLKPGDEIIAIDDTPLAGMNVVEAVNTRLRGELGSVVKLTVKRPGEAKLMSVPMIRKVIPVENGNSIERPRPISS